MDNLHAPIDAPLALLCFYAEAGVDCAVQESPRNRLAEARALINAPRSTAPIGAKGGQIAQSGRLSAPTSPNSAGIGGQGPVQEPSRLEPHLAAAIAEAEQLAADAPTLEALETALAAYQGCPLSQTAKTLIFGTGPATARLMVIGEAPGADEERAGEAFAGPSGLLLDHMLQAIGLKRSQIRIGMSIFWRPPGNRAPTEAEKSMCVPFLRRHITLANPDLLLLLGPLPAQMLLGENQSLIKLRGHWFDYPLATRTIPALVSLPPAYLLRQPSHKAHAWRDLKSFKEAIHALPQHS
jgi:uracil-DNA glycosylase family 4